MLKVKRFWVRSAPNLMPDTEMTAYASRGFWKLGVQVSRYLTPLQWADLGPECGVHGFINDVRNALKSINVDPPDPIDYPTELHPFLGRQVWKSTAGEVLKSDPTQRTFVKPAGEQKLFTGMVWDGSHMSWGQIDSVPFDTPVWCSEHMKFVSEYRTFVLDGEILDCRRYGGRWNTAPGYAAVKAMISAYKSAPRAYTLDVGVSPRGVTHLVEVNDGFAFGHYGLFVEDYAKMLAARWEEMVS